MAMAPEKLTFLLNWKVTPYHAPIFVAKELGLFSEEGLALSIFEPTDPSDVTWMVGSGRVDMGLKAMIHTIAARTKGQMIASMGTLLDEPPTGLLYLKESGIKGIQDIRGRRVGYVGEFGKILVDHIAKRNGIQPSEYKAVRIGMNVTSALMRKEVDTGIGIACYQKTELEYLVGQDQVGLMRIDELEDLGCCCFCSILYVSNDETRAKKPKQMALFMRAIRRATTFTRANPQEAWELLCKARPEQNTELGRKIYDSSFPYFSATQENVDRDWNKVKSYMSRIGLIAESYDLSLSATNSFLPDLDLRVMNKSSLEGNESSVFH